MPTYVYETIAEPIERFEISQRMKDATLTRHPDTGIAIRRVISGGLGFLDAGAIHGTVPHIFRKRPLRIGPTGPRLAFCLFLRDIKKPCLVVHAFNCCCFRLKGTRGEVGAGLRPAASPSSVAVNATIVTEPSPSG